MKPLEINPARVDFVTLRLFCAVAQTGSITKGAERCNIAVSAASRRMADFEAAAGASLLERTAQGVKLTPAGHIAVQHATRLFQGFEQFSSELHEYAHGARGHVRLWTNISALTDFLPSSLASFLAHHPDIRVEIEEQLSMDIVRAVTDGAADIGIFAENTPVQELEVFPYHGSRLVLVCPKTHPMAHRRSVAFAECLHHEFVGSNRGSAILELLSEAAGQAGADLKLRVQVRSFDAMCQMISVGLGVGILPLATCRAQLTALKLHAVPLTDPWATRRLVVAVRSREHLPPAARMLLDNLREHAACG